MMEEGLPNAEKQTHNNIAFLGSPNPSNYPDVAHCPATQHICVLCIMVLEAMRYLGRAHSMWRSLRKHNFGQYNNYTRSRNALRH